MGIIDFLGEEFRLIKFNSIINNSVVLVQKNINMYKQYHGTFPVATDFSDLEKILTTQFTTVYTFSYESDGKYFILAYPEVVRGAITLKTKCKTISFPEKPDPAILKRNCDIVL